MGSSLIARAALLATAAALCAAPSIAQPGIACRGECDSVEYGPAQRVVLRLADGCTVRVTWARRVSCTIGFDIAVMSVEPLTDGCGGRPIAALVNEATDSLIGTHDAGFIDMGAMRDTCHHVGTVYRAACWGYRIECGDTTVVPCDTISCCRSPVLLCVDEIGRRRARRGPSTLRTACAPQAGCVDVCGDRRLPDDWRRGPRDVLDPGSGGTFSSGESDRSDAGGREQPAWPWRDPRPVRSPNRAVRDETTRLASSRNAEQPDTLTRTAVAVPE